MNSADYMANAAGNDLPASPFSVLSNLSSLLYGLYTLLPQSTWIFGSQSFPNILLLLTPSTCFLTS